jgi:hypothetical protein
MSEVNLEKVNAAALQKAEWMADRDSTIADMVKVEQVESAAELEVSGALQTKAGKLIKTLGRHRLDLTRQLDAKKKEIMDQEREMISDLNRHLDRIKGLNNSYATRVAMEAEVERERIAAEERQKAEAAMAEQQAKAEEMRAKFGEDIEIMDEPVVIEQAPAQAIPTGKVSTSSNRTVTKWDFVVVDSARVPRHLCIPDPKKIRAFMNAEVSQERNPAADGIRFSKSVKVQSK